jgi:hypothetical protein
VLHVSRFRPDAARFGEFLACLWQGDVPDSLVLHRWLYVEVEPREMLLYWDGDDAALAWIDQAFGGFGGLSHEVVTDGTAGLAAALERDLDAFGRWLARRGSTPAEVETQLDVRRRGLYATSQEAAAAAGRDWAADQRP